MRGNKVSGKIGSDTVRARSIYPRRSLHEPRNVYDVSKPIMPVGREDKALYVCFI